jgi:probable HAF family extracellular repeat protein
VYPQATVLIASLSNKTKFGEVSRTWQAVSPEGEIMKFRLSMLSRVATLGLIAAVLLPGSLTAQQPHYKLVYLEELGGPHITVDGDISCCGLLPAILNNSGTAVGSAVTSTPNPNSSLINNPYAVPNPFTIAAAAWEGPTPVNLGALPGGYYSFANGISSNGLIAGISETGKVDPRLGVYEVHPTLWIFGYPIDLGTFGGGEGYANQVNDFGQVVGYAQNDKADSYDYFGLGTESRAFLWQYGELKDLGTLGGNDSQANFVNDSGQITGVSYTDSIAVTNTGLVCNQGTSVPRQDPFFWENGKMIDMGNLGGNCAAPAGMNVYGQVAGNSDLADVNAYPHAFLWSKEAGMKDLGTLGGTYAQADALNDAGEVVGTSCTAGDQACFAVLWKDGAITNLGALPGDCGSSAYAINARGQITGDSFTNCATGASRPFLWENGHMYGFHFVPPAGTKLLSSEPATINDRGEIVGYSNLDTGFQAFLLVPCGTEKCEDVTTDGGVANQVESEAAAQGTAADGVSLTPREIVARFRGGLRWRAGTGPLPQKPAGAENGNMSDAAKLPGSCGSDGATADFGIDDLRLDLAPAQIVRTCKATYGCSSDVTSCRYCGDPCPLLQALETCWDLRYKRYCHRCT